MEMTLIDYVRVWPAIFASDFFRYAIAASGLVLFLFAFRRLLERRRIQQRRATSKDVRREITYSLSTIIIFSMIGMLIFVGAQQGFIVFVDDPLRWQDVLIDFIVIVIAHDAYFYWIHRAMHHPRLYRRFHYLHHRSRTPTPWAAYAFSPYEAVLEGAFLPLFLMLYSTSPLVAFAFTTHMIARNVMGHAGIELFPRRWLRWPWLSWITTTTHHDLHHAEFRSNYGLYFRWWDRLMNTEHPEYRQRFEAVTRTPGSDDDQAASAAAGS